MKKRKSDLLINKQVKPEVNHVGMCFIATIVFERDGQRYQGVGKGGRPEVAYGRAKRAGVPL